MNSVRLKHNIIFIFTCTVNQELINNDHFIQVINIIMSVTILLTVQNNSSDDAVNIKTVNFQVECTEQCNNNMIFLLCAEVDVDCVGQSCYQSGFDALVDVEQLLSLVKTKDINIFTIELIPVIQQLLRVHQLFQLHLLE